MAAPERPRASMVERVATTSLPTPQGEFTAHVYRSGPSDEAHVALVLGETSGDPPPIVRLHSQCLTGDVFGSLRCDCGAQLRQALAQIGREGRGVLVYLRQEGREIGLANKLRAYALQDGGLDTVEANEALGFAADPRDYRVAAEILRDLGLSRVRLLTNNPAKIRGLEIHGLRVVERLPIESEPNERNRRYLAAKQSKLGHFLSRGIERRDITPRAPARRAAAGRGRRTRQG
jgi:3,4-dihydroxy 2-butanone 4-phosphate synthase/GTP cyclohydrolase II